MALSGLKLDSDSGCFVSNCFPVRGLIKRDINDGDGAWLVAHRAEQRRRFKAVLCAKPRTYSRIREERKRAEEERIPLTAGKIDVEEENITEAPVLDGYFLLSHCCVEDPADLCSVNIAGLQLSEVHEDDCEIFNNVAYINAGENFLPFEALRGFPSLRELEMPLNGLRNVKCNIEDFPHLEVLDVSYNNLSQTDVLMLGNLPMLRVLHLTGNNFKTLPSDMAHPYVSDHKKSHQRRYARLEVLLIDDNDFSDISVFAALAELPRLRHINMEKNKVFYIPQLKFVEGGIVSEDTRSKSKHSRRTTSGNTPKSGQTSDKAETPAADNAATQSPTAGDANPAAAEPTEKPQADENDFEQLMKDDFSLGELGDRITELEEETAKANDESTKEENSKEKNELGALTPFPELRYLNLSYNQIHEEDALLAVAAWPKLVHLVVHNNPLTRQHAGDPPLLKRFLTDCLGIQLQRKEKPLLVKPYIEVLKTKSRTVSELVVKVPRATIEERLHQLALDNPKPSPAIEAQPQKSWHLEEQTLSDLDSQTSKRMPLPPISPSPPTVPVPPRTQVWTRGKKTVVIEGRAEEEVPGEACPDTGAFFMTQVQDQATDELRKSEQQMTTEDKINATTNNANINYTNSCYPGYELLLEDDCQVDLEVTLPKDIQGNVRALKNALNYGLVYKDNTINLDHVKRSVPQYRRAPQPPPKAHKPKQEKIDEVLENMRTRTTTEELPLTTILKNPVTMQKHFLEARGLLGKVQKRYNSVRVSSMKEAADARKIIDQAFEVLSKPKQRYNSTA